MLLMCKCFTPWFMRRTSYHACLLQHTESHSMKLSQSYILYYIRSYMMDVLVESYMQLKFI